MKPKTFAIVLFTEFMLGEGLFNPDVLKQRHQIVPFEDFNPKEAMRTIIVEPTKSGDYFVAQDQKDVPALAVLTGTPAPNEKEIEAFNELQAFTEIKIEVRK